MMAQLPLLLALLGTALTAIAIFAAPRAVAAPIVSFAPPVAAMPAAAPPDRWPALDDRWPPDGDQPLVLVAPEWPALIDPSAVRCDAVARLALVDALSAVRAPWSAAILRRAGDDEPDPQVRAAARTALAGWD